MRYVEATRSAALLLPAAVVAAGWAVRRPGRREAGGVLLAALWTIPSLLLVNAVALRLGWWRFSETGRLVPVPVDFLLGWAFLWGALPALLLRKVPLWALAAGLAWADLALMPLLAPALVLGRWWLAGEALALLAAFLPAQLLARWTISRTRLYPRAFLQCVCFASLSLGALPLAILSAGGGSLTVALSRPVWLTSLFLEAAALPAAMGIAAVMEFARRGGGTPFPLDPPESLVTTGPYAYVRNPMQLSMSLLLFLTGLFLGDPLVTASSVAAASFSAGFAQWQEGGDLERRFGKLWVEYRRGARAWVPRWKPRFSPEETPMALYYASSCAACGQVGGWIRRLAPGGVDLRPAEGAPLGMNRMTADYGGGHDVETGVSAFCAAVERVNLAWAMASWMARVPVAAQVIQLAADALGAGPREVARHATGGLPPPA